MRLFIAIPIPEPVTEQLLNLQEPIRGMRWQPKSKMHLTLKFLGETNEDQTRDIQSELHKIEHLTFSLKIKGCGYFPKDGPPKVVWAGIEENSTLNELQQKVENLCADLGFEPEDRTFIPHITLARPKRASRSDIMSFINEHEDLQISEVPAKEFVLYESQLNSNGAVHRRVESYQIGD